MYPLTPVVRRIATATLVRAIAVAALVVFAAPTLLAQAQTDRRVPGNTQAVQLAGPRFGITVLSPALQDSLAAHDIDVGAVITQFGWQFEKQFLGQPNGVAGVSELVVLIGGLDQGTFLPSVSWIAGLRTKDGAEFGVGPNASLAGVGLAIAAGMTYRGSNLNIPVNVAVVPSRTGARVSILTGFTVAR